jgi:hypothetical protein
MRAYLLPHKQNDEAMRTSRDTQSSTSSTLDGNSVRRQQPMQVRSVGTSIIAYVAEHLTFSERLKSVRGTRNAPNNSIQPCANRVMNDLPHEWPRKHTATDKCPNKMADLHAGHLSPKSTLAVNDGMHIVSVSGEPLANGCERCRAAKSSSVTRSNLGGGDEISVDIAANFAALFVTCGLPSFLKMSLNVAPRER